MDLTQNYHPFIKFQLTFILFSVIANIICSQVFFQKIMRSYYIKHYQEIQFIMLFTQCIKYKQIFHNIFFSIVNFLIIKAGIQQHQAIMINKTIFSSKILYASKIFTPFQKCIKFMLQSKPLSHRPKFYFADESNKPKTPNQLFKEAQQQMTKQNPFEDTNTYDKPSTNTGFYFMMISALALLGVFAYMEIQTIRADKKQDTSISGLKKVTSTGRAHIGGPWNLLDTKGKPISNKDFEGKYYLIYFGFTNCPDICPNSLMKLSRAYDRIKKMPQSKYFDLKVIFVSVDPDRDTPQKIDNFLKFFNKDFIGVTAQSNNDPNLKECMKNFKIYSSKIQFEDSEAVKQGRKSYTIDHTILTYLMSDDNRYLAHLGGNMGQHDLTKKIVNQILKDSQEKMKKLKI